MNVQRNEPAASSQDFDREDKVVKWLALRIAITQARLNGVVYRRLASIFERSRGGRPWLYFNYIYVFAVWTPVVLAMYVVTIWYHGGWWLLVALPPCWRWLELSVWWVRLLLDRSHTNILAAERNLLFLAADAVAVVTASAIVWRAADLSSVNVSWADALATFTLNGPPDGVDGGFGEAVAVLAAVSGVVLLGAGLALLIGIVGKRVREVPGVYTGPMLPPD